MLEFTVGGDDASTFFPVKVAFVAQGSVLHMGVAGAVSVEGGEDVVFSQEASVVTEDYAVL